MAARAKHLWIRSKRETFNSAASLLSRHSATVAGMLRLRFHRVAVNAHHIMPHLQRIVGGAVPFSNMDSMLVLGALGANLPALKQRSYSYSTLISQCHHPLVSHIKFLDSEPTQLNYIIVK